LARQRPLISTSPPLGFYPLGAAAEYPHSVQRRCPSGTLVPLGRSIIAIATRHRRSRRASSFPNSPSSLGPRRHPLIFSRSNVAHRNLIFWP